MARFWPWRRKSEGFEWHRYVKTTIVLRREHRRERAEEIKRSAQDGAVRAAESAARIGRQGARAAGDGARRASAASERGLRQAVAASGRGLKRAGVASGRGIKRALAASASGSRRFMLASGRGVRRITVASARGLGVRGRHAGTGLRATGQWLGRTGVGSAAWTGSRLAAFGRIAGGGRGVASRPILDFLGRPGVSGPLMLAGVVALLSGVARPLLTGDMDREVVLIMSIGSICLIAGLAPRLRYGAGPVVVGWLAAPFRHIPERFGHTLAGGGAMVAAMLAAVWFWPSGASVSLPSMSLSSFTPFKAPDPITGRAWATGGDTLRIGRQTVRLEGIEAPELDQLCARSNNRRWRCGEAAQAALSRLVAGRQVRCETAGKGGEGIMRATCTAGRTNIAAALVEGGHVLADGGLMATYRSELATAQKAKVGLWGGPGTPERPAEWRARLWAEAQAAAPKGCPIKGKVAGRRGDTVKTYHLPWSPTYMKLRVVSARGERWFCSEAEAQAAGFAPPSEVDG